MDRSLVAGTHVYLGPWLARISLDFAHTLSDKNSSDKTVEILAWCRKFCPMKYFVRRKFFPTKFYPIRYVLVLKGRNTILMRFLRFLAFLHVFPNFFHLSSTHLKVKKHSVGQYKF